MPTPLTIPYAPKHGSSGDRISELMRAEGEIRGRGLLASGDVWSRAIENIGNIAANIPKAKADYEEQQAIVGERKARTEQQRALAEERRAKIAEDEQARQRAAWEDAQLSDLFSRETPPTLRDIVPITGVERASKILQGIGTLTPDAGKQYRDRMELLRAGMEGLASLPEPTREKYYPSIRQHYVASGYVRPEEAPEAYDPAWFESALKFGRQPVVEKPAAEPTGEEGYIRSKFGANPTPAQRLRGRAEFAAAGREPDKPPKPAEQPRLPAAIVEKVAGVDQANSLLKSLESNFSEVYVGPGGGAVAWLAQKTPLVPVNQKEARFYADTATLKNAVIKAITGAQMSEPEAQRIMQQIPDLGDKPVVWRAKVAATRDNLLTLKRRLQELTGTAPVYLSTDPNAGEPIR